jgi:hypothetical protein
MPEVSSDELDFIKKKTTKARKSPETMKPHRPKEVPPSAPAPTLDVKEEEPVKKVVVKKVVSKKTTDKIVEDIKKQNPQKKAPVVVDINRGDIEYVLKTHTKYDLNWYYIKEKFVGLKRWIFSPWRRYCNWWNKKFNQPKNTHFLAVRELSPGYKEEDLWETLEKNSDVGGNKIIANEIKRNMDKQLLNKGVKK